MKEKKQHGGCCNFDEKNAWCNKNGISVLADQAACNGFGIPDREEYKEMDNNIINADYRSKETIIAEVKATIEHVETTAMFGAIRIGKCYTELKELIPHGGWYTFIEENTGHSPKKVERFMKIATEYGDESTPLGSLFSKTTISSDLSIYKALTLIALPEDEVENFVEDNDIGAMTVKELEAKIKDLETINNSSEAKAKKLEEDLQKAEKEKADFIQREKVLADQLNELKESTPGGITEEAQAEIDRIRMEKLEEIKQIAKEKEAAEAKTDKLKNQIEQLKKDQEQIVAKEKEKAAADAKAEAKKETEAEIQQLMETADKANKAKIEAEKKLANASNEDLTKCKIRVNQMQEAFNDAIELLTEIQKVEPEQAAKLREVLKFILGKLSEQL